MSSSADLGPDRRPVPGLGLAPSYGRSQPQLGERAAPAAIVCLFGLFLHFVLSGPLLDANGFSYTDIGGPPWQKVHPGTIFIAISFLLLLASGDDPVENVFRVVARAPAFFIALAINLLLTAWVTLRSGAGGVGTMVDTHLAPLFAAIVLSYAPRWLCRRAVLGFIGLAALNACIGIGESLLHRRLFAFSSSWPVLHGDYFRASALLGHPLANAQLMDVALFVLLAARVPAMLKVVLSTLYLVSLVGFGGRVALGWAILALAIWAVFAFIGAIRSGRLTVLRVLLIATGLMVAPAAIVVGLSVSLNTSMGDRLRKTAIDDPSAESRFVAPEVIDVMSDQELWLGVSLPRELEIAHTLPKTDRGADIENPWVLMLMFLGMPGFVIWLVGLTLFATRLMAGTPVALRLAVISYFVVGSTSNSFGRKDSIFCIMAGIVVCAATSLKPIVPLPQRTAVTGRAGMAPLMRTPRS